MHKNTLFCKIVYLGKEKKGEGKFILRSFVNFNSQTQDGVTNVGFQLSRSYIGYEYTFNNGLKLKSIIDFGKPSSLDDYNYVAYIKNALVSWTRKGFTINGGMIQTTQSALQEKIWAKRYIMMVFHDQYKFGSSADLGFSMEYKFTDWVKADFIMVNGEGYKKIQSNKGFLYGLGATFNPTKEFYIRLYADLNNSRLEGKSNIYGYSALMAYKNDKFTVSGEFNMMQNYKNAEGQNLLGCSVYGSAKVSKLIDISTLNNSTATLIYCFRGTSCVICDYRRTASKRLKICCRKSIFICGVYKNICSGINFCKFFLTISM